MYDRKDVKVEYIIKRIRISIPVCQGVQMPSFLNKRQNTYGFILGMINITLSCKRRNNDSRYASSGSPFLIDHRWCHMIPESAIFVISYNNQGVVSIRPIEYVIDQLYGMALSCFHIRISRMFVIYAE